MSIGQELLNVPMGDMIRQMAFAIAEGQYQLDENSINVAEMMGGLKTITDDEGNITFDDSRVFFGYEYMTVTEAMAFAAIDDALTGGDGGVAISLADAVTAVIEAARKIYNNDKTGNAKAEAPAGNAAASAAWKDFLETEIRVPVRHSMMELGFTPTFYQFVDTIIEVKIAIKITRERSYSVTRTNKSQSAARQASGRVRWWKGSASGQSSSTVSTSQVDATYSGKYSYSAEGASILRTKIVPVPPPAVLEDRIRSYMETEEQRRIDQIEAKKLEAQGGTTGGN